VLKPGMERNGTNQGASKVKNLFLNSSTALLIVIHKDPRDHLYQSSI